MNPNKVWAGKGSSCWTCRLRRKKCDRNHPTCQTCAALRITCYSDEERPDWMDRGPKQDAVVQQLKREVKESAPWRRVDHRHMLVAPWSLVEQHDKTVMLSPEQRGESDWVVLPIDDSGPVLDRIESTPALSSDLSNRETSPTYAACPRNDAIASFEAPLTPSDTVLVMFYIQNVVPFTFPFYRPANSNGGLAWKLDMMIRSPVFRQTAMCQGSFFFCLAQGDSRRTKICQTVFKKVEEALECLAVASRAISTRSSIEDDLHSAVHLMTSMVQVMRFEMNTLTFRNCHTHLHGAIALLDQILSSSDSSMETSDSDLRRRFQAVTERLGPPVRIPPADHILLPSTEQSAFEFSTGLLLFDDVIASISLQRTPHLYKWHRTLLGADESTDAIIDLSRITGCPNWVLLELSELAVLDEWKKTSRESGRLDMMELVHRAMPIKHRLETRLQRKFSGNFDSAPEGNPILGLLNIEIKPYATELLVASIWAHATLVYLHTIISGWQPANAEIQYHIRQILGRMKQGSFPPDLIRAVVWPFCVAGCLADASLEPQIRNMVSALQPQIVFGTTRKAFELVKNVWEHRSTFNGEDLAACFRCQDEIVFLA